ncbi:MAG: coproporphyrinogen dehydrogenase HemZ [Clostridia bacterium]|nr:coproporphyrinogen dehydrogenase HemZ [Clostridia bacterium]
MVLLKTNAAQYFNDIAEEIRLFLGMVDIESEGEGAELEMVVNLFEDRAEAKILPQGFESRQHFEYDKSDPLDKKRMEKRAVKLAVFELMAKVAPADTPWGALTGIRPTKLFRELTERHGEAEAMRMFLKVFCVSPQKTELARRICRVQAPIISDALERDADVYIGIPYCISRCLYCSFGSEVAKSPTELEEYLAYLKRDIHAGAQLLKEGGYRVRAVYIGGGTPTVLSADQLTELFACIQNSYQGFDREFTVEAGRPDTITREKLQTMRDFNVQRISINPQTMCDRTLRLVGRMHTAEDIKACFELAREMGFFSINMDIIAGLTGEDEAVFSDTLKRIIELSPDNLTVHTLAIKRSSRLKESLSQYETTQPSVVKNMVDLGAEAAEKLGMHPYYMYRQKYMSGNLENVGYAKQGKDCIYNVDMMEETVSIIAHGANAMTKRVIPRENRVERLKNPKDVATYKNKAELLFERKKELFLQD